MNELCVLQVGAWGACGGWVGGTVDGTVGGRAGEPLPAVLHRGAAATSWQPSPDETACNSATRRPPPSVPCAGRCAARS